MNRQFAAFILSCTGLAQAFDQVLEKKQSTHGERIRYNDCHRHYINRDNDGRCMKLNGD